MTAVFVCFTFRDARDARDVSHYLQDNSNGDKKGGEEGEEEWGDKVYGYFQDRYPYWLRRRQFRVGELREWVEGGGMELVDIYNPGYALFFSAKKVGKVGGR